MIDDIEPHATQMQANLDALARRGETGSGNDELLKVMDEYMG